MEFYMIKNIYVCIAVLLASVTLAVASVDVQAPGVRVQVGNPPPSTPPQVRVIERERVIVREREVVKKNRGKHKGHYKKHKRYNREY
jgi:hypothetical protein